jgi:hypothetical protein
MALKFLVCIIRSTNPEFAGRVLELWYEYEKGETRAAILVKQMDKLECMHQAVIYEERTGIDMSDFMQLKEKVTLPELQPLLETCFLKHNELKLRRQFDIVVVFCLWYGLSSTARIWLNIFSGGPGVGKGTQSALLATEFNLCHILVGDLLREEAKSPTSPFRAFIPESIRKSVLPPAQLTTQLLKREMSKAQAEGTHRFLLDGFPRSIAQAKDFELKVFITMGLFQP